MTCWCWHRRKARATGKSEIRVNSISWTRTRLDALRAVGGGVTRVRVRYAVTSATREVNVRADLRLRRARAAARAQANRELAKVSHLAHARIGARHLARTVVRRVLSSRLGEALVGVRDAVATANRLVQQRTRARANGAIAVRKSSQACANWTNTHHRNRAVALRRIVAVLRCRRACAVVLHGHAGTRGLACVRVRHIVAATHRNDDHRTNRRLHRAIARRAVKAAVARRIVARLPSWAHARIEARWRHGWKRRWRHRRSQVDVDHAGRTSQRGEQCTQEHDNESHF